MEMIKLIDYPIYKVIGTKDFTESEKADIKSCTVVQNILGHLCVEFCYHKKEKETLSIYYKDEDKVKVNQKLSIDDLTRIVLVDSVLHEKFVIKFK